MKTQRLINRLALVSLSSLLPSVLLHAAPLGTAFTYQGRLAEGGNPAQGIYDLRFTIYDALADGATVGGSVTNAAVAVTNGYFTVTLDFGAGVFSGSARWLEIGVRTNGGGAFTTLTQRQSLTPAPYALFAPSAGAAATATTAASASSVAAANVTGTLALSQLPGTVVTNNATSVTLAGTFTGNGAALTGVNADQVDGQHGAFYQNAANLTSGTLADARLSANVPLLNTNQVFSASNRFAGVVVMTNAANSIVGVFAGNGVSLTNLNGAAIASGTVSITRLPTVLVTNNASGVNLAGSFSGNGAGVTNVNLVTANNQGAISWTTNWGNFVPASSPNVGATPYSVAAADVNNDGKLDLISANSYPPDSSISVLTNNGSGGFVASATITVGRGPVWVTAADVGGNNKVDLVTANSETNTVTVLTNNGSGQFVLAATLTVGANPYAVIAADVNRDGKLDLISANQGDSSLSVLTNGSSGFLLSATLPVGPGPRSVAAADVNGDGKVDLISANSGFNTLTVLTNNGSGGFVLASSPAAGIFPISVAAADLNGDGKTDLVAANYTADALMVLTNNGTGGFVAAPTLTVGAQPYYVAATDVTGDGKVDLVSANFGANTLTLLTNNGTGGFVTAATLTVGNNPHSVAAGDVNGDGKLDLISANAGPSTLSILFNSPASYQANFIGNGASLTSLNAASLTGTAGSLSATNVNVLGAITGNGSGLTNLNASQLTSGTLPVGQLPAAVVTNNETGVTLNGTFSGNGAGLTNLNSSNLTGTIADARLSASVALLNANQVFTGSNRFTGAVTLTNAANAFAGTFAGNGAGLTNLNASQLASGTISLAVLPGAVVTNNQAGLILAGTFSGNGTGLTNLSTTNLTGTMADARLSANVALLNANQAFTGSNRFAGALTLTNAGNILVGTLSGDGAGLTNVNADRLDGQHGAYYQNAANLNAGTLSDSRLSANVALLNTSQAFTGPNNFAGVVALTNTANTVAGTFTGNGGAVTNVNLLSINDQGAIEWATNWGTRFVWAASPAVGTAPWEVAAADVNGDGKLDLISATRTVNTLSLLTNNGLGGFALSSSPVVGTAPQSVVAVDVNSDGRLDLISANNGANTLSVLTNNGSGGFILASSPVVGSGPYLVVTADVNNDGRPDLISVNNGDNTLSVLTNNGGGGFVPASSPAVGSGAESVVAADVNSDGKVDLISANFSANTLTVLTNTGSGGFAVSSSPVAGAAPRSVAAADINGNGKQDLIIANQNANTLTVLTNNGSGSFVSAYSLAVGSTPVSVRATDVTADGRVDLITANILGNSLSVLINNGSGGFSPAFSLGVGVNPASVTAADVNSDGRLDLISANNGANTLTILTNVPAYAATFQGAYIGNGGALTNLNATALTGTIADARLSANVALLNANQVFTGSNRFAGVVAATNTANTLAGTFTGTFTGNGAALTNLVFPTAANYVFSYSTTTQAVVTANTFQDITLNTDAQISGWTHAADTASFTSGQSGLYLIHYDAEATTITTASSTVSLRAVVNGVEIAGSQATANANTANLVVSVSKSFVASVSSGGVLKFQLTGSSVNDRLISNTGTGTTRPSFSCTITRLQ